MKSSNIYAFLGGALIGSIAALLLAPAKGSETREKVKETLEEGYAKVKEQVKKCMPNKEQADETCEEA